MSEGVKVEFGELLRDLAASHERAAAASAPDPDGEVLALAGQARRRRLVRSGAVVAAGAAAVLVCAVAIYGLTRSDPVPPAPQPTVATSSPTPSPTPSPTQEPVAEPAILGPVTVHPLLPVAEPLREGMLEATGPGWSLVTYFDPMSEETHPAVLYLMSPVGDLFEVPTPIELLERSADAPASPVIVDWQAGTTRVLVSRWVAQGGQFARTFDVVDLLSGEVRTTLSEVTAEVVQAEFVNDGTGDIIVMWLDLGPEDAAGSLSSYVVTMTRYDDGGSVVSSVAPYVAPASMASGAQWIVSPDRSRIVLNLPTGPVVADLANLDQVSALALPYPAAPGACGPYAWLDDATVVLGCPVTTETSGVPEVTEQELWAVALGADPQRIASLQPPGALPWAVDGRLIFLPWRNEGDAVRAVDRDGTTTPLSIPGEVFFGPQWSSGAVAVVSGRLVGQSPTEDDSWSIISLEPMSGDVEVLLRPVSPVSGLGIVTLHDGVGGT